MSFKVFMLTVGLAVFALLDSSEGIPTETPVTTSEKLPYDVVEEVWRLLKMYDRAYKKQVLDETVFREINRLSSEGIDIIFDNINALTSEEIRGTIFLQFLEEMKRTKKIGSKTDTEINTMIDLLKSKSPKTPIPVVDMVWHDLKKYSKRGDELVSYCVKHLIGILPSEDIDIILERINALTPAEINGNFFVSLLKEMKNYWLIGNKTIAEIDTMIDLLKSKLPWSTWFYNLITFNSVVSTQNH
ncbi:uncharacterized protein LOC122850961 [Aphidius gifuensis]|uniref:uncharacterized protein LOC122850961 n=1 Tax=Aphidius gifuensis TaxID=684658 RepID=UPI001CDD30E8|nr:uncharacterized protein LOC122850961 [Aphidius gifuensis]